MTASRAAVERAQGSVESAQRDVEVAQSRVTLAQSRTLEAQANYNKVAKDLERMRPLVAKDEISQQQFDAAVASEASAKAVFDTAKAAVREAENNVAASEARVKQARGEASAAEAQVESANAAPQQVTATRARISSAAAGIQQAKAALELARTNLEYTVIKAPVSGYVSRKNVETGQVLQPLQPVMAIVPLQDVWITANFKETQLDRMRVGQPAEISVDAYSQSKFKARIESIAAATGARFSLLPPENASGNFVKVVQRVPVRLALQPGDDPNHVLRPGMSVVATVFINQ
jgi:membrane fusion protein (multidrug efflux system)